MEPEFRGYPRGPQTWHCQSLDFGVWYPQAEHGQPGLLSGTTPIWGGESMPTMAIHIHKSSARSAGRRRSGTTDPVISVTFTTIFS